MTPAERLLAAADLLDKRAGEATEGPWWTEESAATGQHVIQGGMVAEDLWLKVAGHVRAQDATYIATMHPEVGKALAVWLRELAAELAATPEDYCEMTPGVHFPNEDCSSWFCANVARALSVADLILAGETS